MRTPGPDLARDDTQPSKPQVESNEDAGLRLAQGFTRRELTFLHGVVIAAKQAALVQPSHDALMDAREPHLELRSRRWWRLDKPYRSRWVFDVDATRAERM